MANIAIGSLIFDYPLVWLDRAKPRVLASDTPTRGGEVIFTTGANTSQSARPATLKYEWIPWDDVETLYAMAATRATYSMNPEGVTGDDYTIRFAEDGVSLPKHQTNNDVPQKTVDGYDTDLYTGEIQVYIVG